MDHFKIQVNIPIAVLGTKVKNECLKAIKELINWIMHVKSMTYTIQSIKIHKQEMLQMISLLVRQDPKTGYSGIDSIARKSGIKRSEVVKWLTQQNVYSLHKPIRHRFKKRRVIVSKIDDQWQADLVDMQKNKSQNKNFNYILTVIDIFSKFAWAIPIKNKTEIQ